MNILVCGAGGFIGDHLVAALVAQGHEVTGVDLKLPEFRPTQAQKFFLGDLRDQSIVRQVFAWADYDQVYQLAADMGGAGYLFTGEHDADILHNSCLINLNVLNEAALQGVLPRILYTSSACVYPVYNQEDPSNPTCREDSVYPADPDSDYGFEKLFSERLYLAFARNYNLEVRIARLHNVFGPYGSWNNGREKAPAAICRKVAETFFPDDPKKLNPVQIWGPGTQTRSFLYITQAIEGLQRIMNGDCGWPLNLGSEEIISINDLVYKVAGIAGTDVIIENVPGPVGVAGRVSNNDLILEKLGWKPEELLDRGLYETYEWIYALVKKGATETVEAEELKEQRAAMVVAEGGIPATPATNTESR